MNILRSRYLISAALVLVMAACGTSDPAPSAEIQPQVEVPESSAAESTVGAEDPESEVEPTAETTPEGEVQATPEALELSTGDIVFKLIEAETEARFIIDEVLRGEPKTVVGSTNKVSGEILINEDNLSVTQVGAISVEAGTLRTDNNFRNRAIRDLILQTNAYPLITFTPTAIEGIPTDIAVGDTFTFSMNGELTIRDITKEVTFRVNISVDSMSEIRGSASATVLRQDFNLTIPSVPQVAGVDPQVDLEIDFLAAR